VLDEAGEVLLEQKLGTTPKAMKDVFGKMPRSRIYDVSNGRLREIK
jgi:transposase